MPTPLDLARRSRPPVPPGPVEPPAPQPPQTSDLVNLDAYTAEIRASITLHAHARLVALTLASLADRRTCQIPDSRQPTLRQLALACALPLRHVVASLYNLELDGWLVRRPEGDSRFRLGRPRP